MLFRVFYEALSPAGPRGKLSIFIFHRVLEKPDPLLPDEPDARSFHEKIRFIAKNFRVLSLVDAAQQLKRGTLPAASACITFDDGYADNLTVALPILQRHNVVSTFFIATDYLNGGRMWNDDVIEAVRVLPEGRLDLSEYGLGEHVINGTASRTHCYSRILQRLKYFESSVRVVVARELANKAGLPQESPLMMTTRQLQALRKGGMEIGAHTASHPILTSVSDEVAEREIVRGRAWLQDALGEPIKVFAYPNGVPGKDYSEVHAGIVRRLGFVAAVSTRPAPARKDDDVHQLPRFTPWDKSIPKFGARCAINLTRS